MNQPTSIPSLDHPFLPPANRLRFAFFRTHRVRKGFTLIEMLVVLAIIGVLTGILFPVHSSLRYKAWASRTQDTTLQVANAWTLYFQEHRRFPDVATLPDAVADAEKDYEFTMTPEAGNLVSEYFERSDLQKEFGVLSVWGERIVRRTGGTAADAAAHLIRVKLDTGYNGKVIVPDTAEEVHKSVIAWSMGETPGHPVIRSW